MVNFEEYDKIIEECREIAVKKNNLYGDESLKIFDGEGIFLRIYDKVERLKSIYELRHKMGNFCNPETSEDTLKDLINYSIYLIMVENKKL